MRYACLFTLLGMLAGALASARAQTFRDASAMLRAEAMPGRALGASAVDVNRDGLADIYQSARL